LYHRKVPVLNILPGGRHSCSFNDFAQVRLRDFAFLVPTYALPFLKDIHEFHLHFTSLSVLYTVNEGRSTDERSQQLNTRSRTTQLVFSAIMMCLITISTMFIRVPIPFTQGYAHLGDAMIFLSVLILGWRYGAVVAGVGSMMADILPGRYASKR
jgi:ECF-type riboflavin transporter, S component